jgi:L-lactate dehydrogenase complex protein LldG
MSIDATRTRMFARIRAALGASAADKARQDAVRARLERHPRSTIPARARVSGADAVRLSAEMLTAQGADVTRVATQEEAIRAISAYLAAQGLPPALRLGGDPVLWALPWAEVPGLALRFGPAEPSDSASLSRALAGAAETGTLFLASGSDNPTSLAFLPPTHNVLIAGADIVGAYEEAWDRLRAICALGALPRSVNLISGPSRTADIEQTIVRGAHGPGRLHVVILG